MTHLLPYRKINIDEASTIIGIVSWNIQQAMQLQSIIMDLSAASLSNNGGGNISTIF